MTMVRITRLQLRNVLSDPRKLLLVDAVGATLTAASIYLLLVCDFVPTGLPRSLLVAFVVAAACSALFDIVAFSRRWNARVCLRIIAGLNSSYCVFVLSSMAMHRDTLTLLGAAYFGSEIAIVLTLAIWEIIVSAGGDS